MERNVMWWSTKMRGTYSRVRGPERSQCAASWGCESCTAGGGNSKDNASGCLESWEDRAGRRGTRLREEGQRYWRESRQDGVIGAKRDCSHIDAVRGQYRQKGQLGWNPWTHEQVGGGRRGSECGQFFWKDFFWGENKINAEVSERNGLFFLWDIPEHACLLMGMIDGEGETGGSGWGTVKEQASRERRGTGVCGHVGDHGRLPGGGRGASAVETKGRRLGCRWGTLCGLTRSLICISHAPDLHVPCLLGVLR